MTVAFGATPLPDHVRHTLRRARRLEWASIAYLVTCVVLVYVVMGSSQAMKAAWIEDCLSFIPPLAFLYASHRVRRAPDPEHPYGFHRAVASAHLAAAVALLTMGAFLVYDSLTGLLAQEHPPIGSFHLLGHTVWAGWPMVAVMTYTAIGPVILGRLKMPLSDTLHDKVLYADADMNKADWMTAVGAIVGVLGIGIGWWWADAAAALLIAGSILRDGVTQLRNAAGDLMDARARTYDDDEPHPLIRRIEHHARTLGWVTDAAARVRDEGHVFHVELFVVPTDELGRVTTAQLEALRGEIADMDWKLDDIVVAPVSHLPEQLVEH